MGARKLLQADARQRGLDALRRLAAGRAGKLERQPHVRRHVGPRHQGRLLKHEADAAAARGLVGGPAPSHSAGARLAQARNDAERRRFAAARRAEQRQKLAVAHLEIEAGQRLRAVRKRFRHAVQRDDGGRGTERRDGYGHVSNGHHQPLSSPGKAGDPVCLTALSDAAVRRRPL
jgi:hypothetical protein